MAEHHEWKKSYAAFDAIDSSAHLVMAENHGWNTFYNAFGAFECF